MLLEALSIGVAAYVAYSIYGSRAPGTVAEVLDERINNGYRFRDVTYADSLDLAHPDVKNNQIVHAGLVVSDRGVNGLKRGFSQLYSGTSEITQLYRTDNLFL